MRDLAVAPDRPCGAIGLCNSPLVAIFRSVLTFSLSISPVARGGFVRYGNIMLVIWGNGEEKPYTGS
jgi:hypothetical protein